MSYNNHSYCNPFGGVASEAGQGLSDTDYVRSTPVPCKIGGIEAGTTFSGSVQDCLDKLLYPYQNPLITLTSSVPTSTRQKGVDSINGVTLTATVTQKTKPLVKVEFYQGSTLLDTQNCVNGKSVYTFDVTTAINDTTEFSAKVYDSNSKTALSTIKYLFYYPDFSLSTTEEIENITIDDIALGSMRLEPKANKSLTFTGVMARYIFCYPQSWGSLKSITDKSGYEYLNAFQKVPYTYTSGTDSVPMYAYVTREQATLTSYIYNFKF